MPTSSPNRITFDDRDKAGIVYQHFPVNCVCPLCGGNHDGQMVLVTVAADWSDPERPEGVPIHLDCIDLAKAFYSPEAGVLFIMGADAISEKLGDSGKE